MHNRDVNFTVGRGEAYHGHVRTLWTVVLLLAACGKSDNTNLPPPPGGTTDGGGFALPDARTGGSGDGGSPGGFDGGGAIKGRVCLASDPRALTEVVSPTACASTGAGGLTVYLGGSNATTADDGTFTIAAPGATSGLVWHVEGPGIVPSTMLFSDYEIPALSTATMSALEAANGVTLVPGEGSIFAQILRDGAGDPDVTVTCTPTPDYGTFSDGATATQWAHAATGAFGTAWCPGLDVGDGTATVKASDTSTPPVVLTTSPQPIEAGGITFVQLVYP